MNQNENALVKELIFKLTALGDGTASLEEKLHLAKMIWQLSHQGVDAVVAALLNKQEQCGQSLEQVGAHIADLREKIEHLIGKLWFPAIFLAHVGDPKDRRVLVHSGNMQRVVGVCDQVDVIALEKGCAVMLNTELSAVVAVSAADLLRTGDIATVVEKTAHGSLILRNHDQEVEVEMALSLQNVDLSPGDRVRWNSSAFIAFERVGASQARRFLLGEIPNVRLDEVGGQRENLDRLIMILSAVLLAPDKAADYGLSGRSSILLTGSPGCGKTLMVRAAVAEIARISGRQAKFFVVKPAEWESSFVGASEKNVRDLFASLRETAKDGSLVVLFLDEVDCVGRHRGHPQGYHADRTLNSLLAELDGFSGREGIAVVSTTNRKDLIDSALLQRLSDQELMVRQPDIEGAMAIFSIHLRPTVPFNPNSDSAMLTRNQIIEIAVARIYSPNSPYNELCRIKFRDGKTKTISARDFASGRLFEQICRAACMSAFERELRTGQRGLQTGDIEDAIAEAMEKIASSLTVHSIRNQLPDLPTDVDVVAVEPVIRKVSRPHRLLNARVA